MSVGENQYIETGNAGRSEERKGWDSVRMVKSQIVMILLVATGIVGMDGRTGLADTRQYVRAFMGIYLRGAPQGASYQTPLMPAARFYRK